LEELAKQKALEEGNKSGQKDDMNMEDLGNNMMDSNNNNVEDNNNMNDDQ